MTTKDKDERHKALEGILYKLSENLIKENDIPDILLKLINIYKDNFWHRYSYFFSIIVKICEGENQYDKDYLTNNLEDICKYLEYLINDGRKDLKKIYSQLHRLNDDLNAEIGRLNYQSRNNQKIEDITKQINYLNEVMSKASKDLQQASKQAASIQTELIAVLSVFAAIVVTFSGSFTFLGSVMTSIKEVTYEAVILAAIVCGMVIFNIIFLLMYFVGKITNRNIYAECTTPDCSCPKKCKGLNKIRKRLPYVFYFNIFCIVGIIVDCIVWYIDIRNWLGL